MEQSRITRIQQMEEVYDRVKKDLATLAQYEESKLWQEDYEADERGELPANLKRGVAPLYYRHFRNGQLYRLLTFATIEATGEEAVVYQALYGDHRVWIRPKANFFEEVLHEGKMVPRFQPVE